MAIGASGLPCGGLDGGTLAGPGPERPCLHIGPRVISAYGEKQCLLAEFHRIALVLSHGAPPHPARSPGVEGLGNPPLEPRKSEISPIHDARKEAARWPV